MEKHKMKMKKPSWHTVVTVVIALCLLFMVASAYRSNAAPYGKVELDMGTRLTMSLSRREKVLAVEAGDGAGEALLEAVDYRRMSREEGTDRLLQRALDTGVLEQGDGVRVTVTGGSPEWRQLLAEDVRRQLAPWQDRLTVTVTEKTE